MDNKNEVIFNIITRTSNRPNYFIQCQESISKQINLNDISINKFITFDDENDLSNYIEKFARDNKNVTVIEVTKPIRKNRQHFPYNLYLNEVFPHIKTGWNIILNDDTYFNNDNALSIISNKIIENGINNTNYLYLWNCNKLGKVCPKASSGFKQGDIHLSCFAFHSSKYDKALFPNKNCQKLEDELHIVNNLLSTLKCVFINETLTATDNFGDGLRKDNESFKQKIKVKINTQNSEHIFDKDESPNKISLSIKESSNENSALSKTESNIEESELEDQDESEIEDEDENKLPEVEIANEVISVNVNETSNDKYEEDDESDSDDNEEEELNETLVDNNDVPNINSNVGVNSNVQLNESSKLITQLIELLNQNHSKIYILTDSHIKMLASFFYDAVEYEKKSEQLVDILEKNYFQLKTNKLNKKLRDISLRNTEESENNSSSQEVTLSLSNDKESNNIAASLKKTKQSKNIELQLNNSSSSSSSFINNIYVIVDNDTNKNIQLNKNKIILDKSGYKYEITTIKDMSLPNFQKKISDKLSEAKTKGYEKVLFINGNDLLSIKFKYILDTQIENIKNNSYNVGLWLMGNTNDFSQKDILNTKFNLEVYKDLYDDIVNAKIITEDKAKHHWKQYGHREGRFASINIFNNRPSLLNGLSGILISEELFDDVIQHINKSPNKSVFNDLQSNPQMKEFVFSSYPELIIPNSYLKNAQTAVKYGWYLNLYVGSSK